MNSNYYKNKFPKKYSKKEIFEKKQLKQVLKKVNTKYAYVILLCSVL